MKVQRLTAADQRGVLITWSVRVREVTFSLIGMAFRIGVYWLCYRLIYAILHPLFY